MARYTSKGVKDYMLPLDFATIQSIEIGHRKVFYQVRVLSDVAFDTMLSEWNRHTDGPFGRPTVCTVIHIGRKDILYVRFDPVPDKEYEIKLRYVPKAKYWS